MADTPPDLDLSAHPNDAFFKTIFSEPQHAIAFFKNHLPSDIAKRIDWPSLAVLPTSFVQSSLRQIHSDLLFSVTIEGHPTLLYLLFEHQSTVDPTMPLRLFGYIGEILTQHHKAHGLPLPPVLPFVFHQGPDAWNISTAFEDLFALPPDVSVQLLPFLPKFQYALLDLSRYQPVSQEKDDQLKIILQLMKLAREQQVLEFFKWLASTFSRQISDVLLRKVLLYALHSDSDLDVGQIFSSLSSNPELGERTMSVAEKLIAKGEARGEAKGEARGMSKGLWIGKILMTEEFLGRKTSNPLLLETLSLTELEKHYNLVHQEYEMRFKKV